MADDNADLMAEFQEFLTQKRQAESDAHSAEDFDVEIWDETGRGVRTKRSHAKPFLQSLGIDMDADPNSDQGNDPEFGGKSDGKGNSKPTGSGKNSTGTQSTVRKYFTSQVKK